MARILVLWCPDWPVVAQLSDQPPDTPMAVLERGGVVLACSPRAREEGVRRGMRRRDAQARCPELVLRDHDAEADARVFEPVLALIESLSPGVAPLRPGLCALTVPARYYGGEVEAAAVITEELVEHGLWDVRCGIADDLFTAEQAARRAPVQEVLVVPAGGSPDFVRDLPLEVLDDATMVDLLRRLGLRTLGDFARLPEHDVHTRFGTLGAMAHRLARGEDHRLVARREVPPDLIGRAVFDPALTSSEAIAFSLRITAESFVSALAERGQVATAVRIEIDADGALAHERAWRHPRWFSSRDLVDRVRWQTQVPGVITRPVDEVRIVPEAVATLGDHAESLFGTGVDEHVERGVARVQSLVGPEAVRSAGVQGGRDPRARQLTAPWGDRPVGVRSSDEPWPGSIPAVPAPARVLPEPVAAQVVGAEGQSVGVTGRGGLTAEPARFRPRPGAAWQPVAAWAGPWPIDDLWWDEHAARRVARFQVVGVDGSAWLMCVENGHWWTEARYD
ncbi:DNA polymerase Y family protein [uncultured Aeromicrobium sp.]|uniref:DNA polymerase Y family protein n=1 Tax=uncultured Aeromicrobium sp. TaxID=337820 RepID=UPI0025FDEBCA|nr:DNA polymerase Y family protein [uncultured Aeromicrobium sp.]